MDSVLVELERVGRIFDSGQVTALQDVTLAVRPGEWLTIVGPSGSGKSTLLNLMCGLDRPTAGRVLFDGQQPLTSSDWAQIRSQRIGFIFQAFHLLPTLTAAENVEIPMFGVMARSGQRRERAEALLARVGLENRRRHLPSDLSGGERQRVAIARSLASSPDLLLADEPTGNLDSKSADQIIRLIEDVHREDRTAIVLVTHNPRLAPSSSRWLRMADGRLERADRNEVMGECYS